MTETRLTSAWHMMVGKHWVKSWGIYRSDEQVFNQARRWTEGLKEARTEKQQQALWGRNQRILPQHLITKTSSKGRKQCLYIQIVKKEVEIYPRTILYCSGVSFMDELFVSNQMKLWVWTD